VQKALFLDRDGVINIDSGYVATKEEFLFNEGIFTLLKLFRDKGYLLFIITNQSGIGRSYYSLKDFEDLSIWMLEAFKKEHITIESIEYCPHLPTDNCSCRKPRTGMIDSILSQYPIDLHESWLIGDKQSDIDLAENAQIKYSISIGKIPLQKSTYHFSSIELASCMLTVNDIVF
jgi:D-glycero-D-manno-heptose 1,7-bisphosphate phosphatase